ncbi:MAG: acyltransferase [Candidatus Eremiobacteraeota bacterium]|nr:acyltransferase [Candidatus Eremiobacteraeota bacterium]
MILRRAARRLKAGVDRILGRNTLAARLPGIALGREVIVLGENKFTYGKNCFIDVRAYLNCAGGLWNDYRGHIAMGDNCEIGPYSVLHGAGGITLGNGVHLGPHCVLYAHTLQRDRENPEAPPVMNFAPIVLEDGVMVGSNVAISFGVRIGRNSIIAPGSSVVSDIPPNSYAAGSPARVFMVAAKKESAG